MSVLETDPTFMYCPACATPATVQMKVAPGSSMFVEQMAPNWSSYNFLSVSKWIFADFFQSLAANPKALAVVDFLNIWGLILIGLALFFGILTRYASAFGIAMLSLYYVANPPFLGMDFGVPAEG